MEVWKDIEGYEGLYQVSSLGRVKSLDRITPKNRYFKGKILVNKHDSQGYQLVCLCVDGKQSYAYIHRLVAKAFIPNPENKETVNHKDENKANNCVENLEWMTMRENANYGTRNERCTHKPKPIFQIKNGFVIKRWESAIEASKTLGISLTSIRSALCGDSITCCGFMWRYVYTR